MTIDQAIAIGVQHHEAGRLQEADAIYRQVLAHDPANPEALHLLGCLALQTDQLPAAIDLIGRAITARPNVGRYYNNLGEALRRGGRPDESIAAFQKAIALEPPMAAAYSNLGHAFSALKRYDESVNAYQAALARQPNLPPAFAGLGGVLTELKRYDEAMAVLLRAIELTPNVPDLFNNLGITFLRKGELQQSARAFQRAIELNGDYADAYSNLSHVLDMLKDYPRAIAACRRSLELNPNNANAYANLGNILNNVKDYDQSIVCSRKAIELRPDFAEAYNNLAISHHHKGEYDEALRCYTKALEFKSDFYSVLSNLGNLHKELGDPDEAIAACQRALAIKPDYAEAHVNMSLPLLLKGQFAQGWDEYEWRWKWPDFPTPVRFPGVPRWDGSELPGRTMLLHAEQGLGDSLQFIRYVPLIVRRGMRVIVEAPAPLLPVLRTVDGVAEIYPSGALMPPVDVQLPMLSLPYVFATNLDNIPADVPYLKPDRKLAQSWTAKLRSDKGLKVGLSWAGSPLHKNDKFRSIPLGDLARLGAVRGITFYSLQKGAGSDQAAHPPPGLKLVDWTDQISDFGDTAALVSRLDLVISVDTALVHLVGGLGKPLWMLLPYAPDFRWLLDRTDSPWYPTMRIFRQPARLKWDPVIDTVAAELAAWARDHDAVKATKRKPV